jgi:hypothetical protein
MASWADRCETCCTKTERGKTGSQYQEPTQEATGMCGGLYGFQKLLVGVKNLEMIPDG